MRQRWFAAIMIGLVLGSLSLASYQPPDAPRNPKLVVVLVFDQMRGDYLRKWQKLFGEGGFKRLIGEGAWFTNCHYPYAGTWTAAGHASLLTGCTPRDHGIVSNEWYDRKLRKFVGAVQTGPLERDVGPEHRLKPTVGDVLLGLPNSRGKMASLSVKPRSAILLAALRAQICYWLSSLGIFETALHYRKESHEWINEFNAGKNIDKWVDQPWMRLRPDLDYAKFSGADDVEFEGPGYKQGRTFPHPTPNLSAVINSPFGNEILLELAKKAIRAEKLGQRDAADLLCLSFSSNDLVGHCYGPDSQEVLDITLRSDRIVKELLDFLDKEVGKGNYAVALSADHGVCPIPEVARAQGKTAGYVPTTLFTSQAENFLKNKFGPVETTWIEPTDFTAYDTLVQLNQENLKSLKNITAADVEKALADWLAKQPGIEAAYTRTQLLSKEALKDPVAEMFRQSATPNTCGDVVAALKPYHLVGEPIAARKEKNKNYATTHGSHHPYDTHVPLLVMGPGIRPGIYEERTAPLGMAFIVARLLQVQPPAGAVPKYRPPESLWSKKQ